MGFQTKVVTITTAGGAGVATGSASVSLGPAVLYAAVVTGNAPATADITLTSLGRTYNIEADRAAPYVVYPREQANDAAGAPIAGSMVLPFVNGMATVNVAQADNGTVTVVLVYDEVA